MTPDQLDVSELNDRIAGELLRNLAWNSAQNWARIREEARRDNVCVTSLPHAIGKVPAIILGSGPTLDEALGYLYGFPGAIFCGCSQAHALDAHSIVPDYMIAVDTHKIVAEQVEGIEWGAACTLIAHQGIAPELLEAWKGPRKYMRMWTPDGAAMIEAMYPWLRRISGAGGFTAFGCTPNTEFQLAAQLGYSPIYLAGVDFGFPGGKRGALHYKYCGHGKYQGIPAPRVEGSTYEENGVSTTREMMLYKLMFLALWKRYGVPVVRWGTGPSAMDEVVAVDPGTVELAGLDLLPHADVIDARTVPFGVFASKEVGLRSAGEFCLQRERLAKQIAAIDKEMEPWAVGSNGIWIRS